MTGVAKLATVTPGDELLVAVRAMDETGAGQLPVLEDGRLVGAVGREQVLRYIAARAELGV
jgi:predicted transcriptional regulator